MIITLIPLHPWLNYQIYIDPSFLALLLSQIFSIMSPTNQGVHLF